MKFLVQFFLAFILAIISSLFTGFIYMETYELALAPLINYLGNAPHIPFIYFLLLALGISAISKIRESKYEIKDFKFWANYVGSIISKLIMLFILWIINNMFF